MPSYYIYLISSLPMLQFNAKSPFSVDSFLNRCAELIPAKDVNFIKQVITADAYTLELSRDGILSKWKAFDLALRNELARARAARRKISADKFLHEGALFDINITHIAHASLRKNSILEAEKYLDLERWRVLDEICAGHYFDLDFLLVYALKLAILERWAKIDAADKAEMAKKVLPQ